MMPNDPTGQVTSAAHAADPESGSDASPPR